MMDLKKATAKVQPLELGYQVSEFYTINNMVCYLYNQHLESMEY